MRNQNHKLPEDHRGWKKTNSIKTKEPEIHWRRKSTSWCWHGGELWAQWIAPASDPGQQRCHGSTKSWIWQKGVSRRWLQSCFHPWYQANEHPRSCLRWARRTPASRLPLWSHRTLVGLVEKTRISQQHSTLHCPLKQTQFNTLRKRHTINEGSGHQWYFPAFSQRKL